MRTDYLETALDQINQTNYALGCTLKGKSVKEVAKTLGIILLEAVNRHDDAVTCQYLKWTYQCLFDQGTLPAEICNNYRPIKKEQIKPPADLIEEYGERNRAQEERKQTLNSTADSLVEWLAITWQNLPTSGPKTYREFLAQDESQLVQGKGPTLRKAKQLILKKIAAQWQKTDNEEVADRCLGFFFKVKANLDREFDDEEKSFLEAICSVLNQHFPVARLERQIRSTQMGQYERGIKGLLWREMVIAWAKYASVPDIQSRFEALSLA
ncbi:hypothetical protein KC644_01910 [Candidatus Berkelbacteria bacterium]|nr:hypothetical protein [Candidatus Berkelbacteria bacterium]